MYVKPNAGLSVRDPDLHDLLPATGRNVPDSDYWQRRLRDGDVIEGADPELATQVVQHDAALANPVVAAPAAAPAAVDAIAVATTDAPEVAAVAAPAPASTNKKTDKGTKE